MKRIMISIIVLAILLSIICITASATTIEPRWVACDCGGQITNTIIEEIIGYNDCAHTPNDSYVDQYRKRYRVDRCSSCKEEYSNRVFDKYIWYCTFQKGHFTK